MRPILPLAAAAVLGLAAPAGAAVTLVQPTGFESVNKITAPVSPAQAYAALGRVGEWWNPDHTYSGDAANLSLPLSAGACFCEAIPADGGGVEHMRVILARPGQTLRLRGGLGPLQAEPVVGVLTWSLRPVEGGVEIVQTYAVHGRLSGGAEALAPAVDRVLADQLSRLGRRLGAAP